MSMRSLPPEPARPVQQGWFLAEHDAHQALHAALRAHQTIRPAGTVLRDEGQAGAEVIAVLSGWLALAMTIEDGQRQIIDFVLPGEMVPPGPDPTGVSVASVETVTETVYAAIPPAVWARLKADHPAIARLETAALSTSLSRMSERLLRLGKGSALMRVAHALMELCARVGAFDGGGRRPVHLPMTQQRLGDYTGLSSVHVCRTMRKLVRLGVLSVADHMDLVIRDPVALAGIAGIDPALLWRSGGAIRATG